MPAGADPADADPDNEGPGLPLLASPAERAATATARYTTSLLRSRYDPGTLAVGAVFLALSVVIAAYVYAGASYGGSGGLLGTGASLQDRIQLAVGWVTTPDVAIGCLLAGALLWYVVARASGSVARLQSLTSWGVVLGAVIALAGIAAGLVDNIGQGQGFGASQIASIALCLADVILGLATVAVCWQAYWLSKLELAPTKVS